MICEMCGKDAETINRVRVEGSTLSLCPECSRFGTVLNPPAPPAPAPAPSRPTAPWSGLTARPLGPRRLEERDLFREMPELELAEDWGKRVRQARERLGWTPEELGKRLNEKKSVVLKLEGGSIRPPDALVKKLEQLLKVRLRADAAATG